MTDRSKVVVRVLFFCVTLWFLLRGVSSIGLLFVLVLSVLFSIVVTSLCEKRGDLCASRAFVCLYIARIDLFSLFSSSWCRGFAAAYDCGTPWNFLLTFHP